MVFELIDIKPVVQDDVNLFLFYFLIVEYETLFRSSSSTGKYRNYKVERRDLGSNPGPHSCM